jgi:periplasmic divalent cation tolerance protein
VSAFFYGSLKKAIFRSMAFCAWQIDQSSLMKYLAVFTTVGSLPQAQSMARSLVQRKLAACAQISEIESFYSWDGALHNDKEYRLLLKTTSDAYPALEAAIRELHTYALPAIHAVAFEQVYVDYAEWIDSNITSS